MFDRLEILIGKDNLKKLKNTRVLVLGCGGVGGYVIEGLVRSGIERISIVDKDIVDLTNINRQIIALHSTIGKFKTDCILNRAKDINPNIEMTSIKEEITKENIVKLNLKDYDYIVDAIDDVPVKVALAEFALEENVNLIIATGTANKIHPEMLTMTTLDKTEYDPLAKKMRTLLRGKKISKLPCLTSKERPILTENKVLGSSSFVPSIGGLLIASYVVNDIITK